MNSRFDMTDQQWKSGDRSVVDLLDQSDRKITRNQKRRHDEINHIQKVNKLTFCGYFNKLVIYIAGSEERSDIQKITV